jgi:N-ethylmaleimide reductase
MKRELKLLSPLSTKFFTFGNRVVMAPMNRRRAENGIPGESSILYFRQRAGAGLIITDNTAIAPNGIGYLRTPGIYNDQQAFAWKKIANEVHTHDGKIFMQLVHAGRIGHIDNNEDGMPLVAPSTTQAQLNIRVSSNVHLPASKPIALTTLQVQDVVDIYIAAAKNAIASGMDGVEIHAAHGFLIEQFLHPMTNQRTDKYGGNIINRCRFLFEIVEGIAAAIGKERTGVRLSPYYKINDLPPYPEELETHRYLTDELNKLDIMYIHFSNTVIDGVSVIPDQHIRDVRQRFKNIIILAGNFDSCSAERALDANLADMIAFGRPFIANPDLVERFRLSIPLAQARQEFFYEGGDTGYIDYPEFNNIM